MIYNKHVTHSYIHAIEYNERKNVYFVVFILYDNKYAQVLL